MGQKRGAENIFGNASVTDLTRLPSGARTPTKGGPGVESKRLRVGTEQPVSSLTVANVSRLDVGADRSGQQSDFDALSTCPSELQNLGKYDRIPVMYAFDKVLQGNLQFNTRAFSQSKRFATLAMKDSKDN